MKNKIPIKSTLQQYITNLQHDPLHRFHSWDQFFQAFGTYSTSENLPLHLAFYLASWGMYRGSSGLLQKNYLIHERAIEIIQNQKYRELQCHSTHETSADHISLILELKIELSTYYESIEYSRGSKKGNYISPTDTLISKIILGTLGCTPAYDTYFIHGLNHVGIKRTKFEKDSLQEIYRFADENSTPLIEIQQVIKSSLGIHYPMMKLIDMYFWQIGFDLIEFRGNKK